MMGISGLHIDETDTTLAMQFDRHDGSSQVRVEKGTMNRSD